MSPCVSALYRLKLKTVCPVNAALSWSILHSQILFHSNLHLEVVFLRSVRINPCFNSHFWVEALPKKPYLPGLVFSYQTLPWKLGDVQDQPEKPAPPAGSASGLRREPRRSTGGSVPMGGNPPVSGGCGWDLCGFHKNGGRHGSPVFNGKSSWKRMAGGTPILGNFEVEEHYVFQQMGFSMV